MMHMLRHTPAALILLTAACTAATQQVPAAGPAAGVERTAVASGAAAVERAAAVITAAAVEQHIAFLASDELRGRDTPSPGLEEAARYLSGQLRSHGLRPAGDDGTFIQRYPFEQVRLDRAGLRVEARGAADTSALALGTDMFVLPARIDSVVGVPLYAGRPGGTRLDADATGRIVVFFVADTLGQEWQRSVSTGLQAAFEVGAGAAVIVVDSLFGSASMALLADQLSRELAPLPVLGISYAAAQPIFRTAGMELGAVSARSGAPVAMQGVTLAVRTPVTELAAQVPNVVAVLPGSDPRLRDEYVVFSAHFDHVGVGTPDATGDSIYNGADDNASGTSAVLAIAAAFSALDRAPARSVMFVFVSGEEKGLLGSAHFVGNPPVPVSQMVANINLDMVGRNAPDTVVAIGQDYSSLGPAVQAVAARHPEIGLVVAPDLWPDEQLFFRSDHFNFAAVEVPAIFFTTGLHDDYHRPGDQAHLIDNGKVARIGRLLFRFAHQIAEAPQRPAWTAEGLAELRRATRPF
jgi:hypothetical protein